MNLLELALQNLKSSGGPASSTLDKERLVDVQGMKSDDREGVRVLEPLAPVIATMHAAESDTMRLARDLRGSSALFSQLRNIRLSQLRNIRREIEKLLSGRRARQGAAMHAAESDTMRLAWDLRGSSALFSQLRNIRREIEKLLSGRRARQGAAIIALTSAMPGEGKSFLSLALARALAAGQDRGVVLVDADLPKRHLTELLGTSDQPGLVECLAHGQSISEVLCRSDHPAINFLPAGRWRSDAPDLMCGTKMDRILESFRQCDERHVFVVDTAPILAFGETAYLAEQADLVVLVIRADRTPRPAAEEALRKLAADRPVALVLNGQQGSILDGYYGYGDSYGDYLPAEKK